MEALFTLEAAHMSEEFQKPQPTGLSKDEILTFAGQVAELLDLGPGGQLSAVVERLGGRINLVAASSFDKTVDGSVVIQGLRNFDIHLADDVGPLRQRFTIGHELGHYFLHFLANESAPMRAERYGYGPVEREADWFSTGLLMPEAHYKAAHEKFDGALSDIAAHFSVSATAARRRARELGLEVF